MDPNTSDKWDVEDILQKILKNQFKAIANKKEYVDFLREILKKRKEMGMEPPIAAVPIILRHMPKEIIPEHYKNPKYEDFPEIAKWMFTDERARKHLENILLYTTGHAEYEHTNPYLDKLLNAKPFDGMKILDIGTATGSYSASLLNKVQNNIQKLVRTNLSPYLEVIHHPTNKGRIKDYVEVKPFNIAKDVIPEKFDVVIYKDIEKFLEEDGRKNAWKNIKEMTNQGSIVIHGGQVETVGYGRYVGFMDGESAIKLLVHHNGKLVEVEPEKFINEVSKIGTKNEYLKRLPEILKRTRVKHGRVI
ncbi:MAG: hypothetical protein F7B61_03245 [Caldisphaeraceae archaeon]|nr:hypothetical protein [Caldisphaeraceae archaeon]